MARLHFKMEIGPGKFFDLGHYDVQRAAAAAARTNQMFSGHNENPTSSSQSSSQQSNTLTETSINTTTDTTTTDSTSYLHGELFVLSAYCSEKLQISQIYHAKACLIFDPIS